jgi:hypothetical protein
VLRNRCQDNLLAGGVKVRWCARRAWLGNQKAFISPAHFRATNHRQDMQQGRLFGSAAAI